MSAIRVQITRRGSYSIINVDGRHAGMLADASIKGNVSDVIQNLVDLMGVENVIVMTCHEDATPRLSPLSESI